jgi:hypothetical protein
MKKYLLSIAFTASLLIAPALSHAATLGAQLDSSGYVQVNANSGTTYQDLGTNLVGYMGSMDVIMSGYMINNMRYRVHICPNSENAATCIGDMSNVKYSNSWPVSSTPTHFVTVWSPAVSVTGKRVAIYFYAPGNGETQKIHGATTDKWADGACYHYTGGGACSGISDIYFAMTDGYPDYIGSQITSFLPAYSATPITSPVTLSGSYYIDRDIASSTPSLLITLLDTDNGNYSEYHFGLVPTASGNYNYSTTTGSLADGRYHMSIMFEDSPNVYVATSSEFIINRTITPPSSLSLYFPATSTPVTITTGLSDCDSMLTASGIGCAVGTVFKNVIYLLFVPDTYTRLRFQEQYNDLKYKAPWGYVFLVANDISGYSTASTTSLSSGNFAITFPSNTKPLYNATSTQIWKGKTLTFIDWTQMASSTTNNYWGSGWSSLNSMINLMLGAGFFFWLWKFASSKIHP